MIRTLELTRVPLAPGVISGLINLRGQIVTAIDLRRRLELPPRQAGIQPMHQHWRLSYEALTGARWKIDDQ